MDAQIESVTVVVRRLRVVDKSNRDRVWRLLQPVFAPKDEHAIADLWNFCTLIFTTESITGVDMFIPDPNALFDVWEQAWHKYNELDFELVQSWIAESNSVNAAPNEHRYLPPDTLNDDEKKSTPMSAANFVSQ